MATTAVGIQCKPIIIIHTASCLDRSPTTTSSLSLNSPSSSPFRPFPSVPLVASSVPLHRRATTAAKTYVVLHGGPAATRTDDMSHRVVSDLSHSNSRSVTDHHQGATTSNHEGGKAKQKPLSLLISSVVSWTRSESSSRSTKQQQTNGGGTGGGRRRRGLEEIVLAVRKYVAMVEQLFTSSSSSSYSSASSSRVDAGSRRRQGWPHTFTSARRHGAGGDANANAAAQSSSKRHRGPRRLSSAPASLRGSPATSGHLSVGESVAKAAATSSEVSTMEELQSAIQAAIAHCKNSVTGGGGGDKQQQR